MFENIGEKLADDFRWELQRQGFYPEKKLHVVWGFGDGNLELTRESHGLLSFELDQLKRVERKEVIIVPSEIVGSGKGKYVLYARFRDEVYEFCEGI